MSQRQNQTPDTLSVTVPLTIRKRGGRKLVLSPS